MSHIGNSAKFVPLLLAICAPALAGTEVSCRIDSDNFLEAGYKEIQTDNVILSDAPTTAQGKRLIFTTKEIDIWVYTSGYSRTSDGIAIGSYDIQAIVKEKRLSSTATSASDSQKMAVLTLAEMDDKQSPISRLIITCFGTANR